MASLTALAMPAVHAGFQDRRVDRAAATIVSALVQARGMSMRTGRETLFTIDVVEGRLMKPGAVAWTSLDHQVSIGLRTAAADLSPDGRGAVRFFPEGTTTGAVIRLSSGAAVREVTVDWLTGGVHVAVGQEP